MAGEVERQRDREHMEQMEQMEEAVEGLMANHDKNNR
jgi:hypothetical protein